MADKNIIRPRGEIEEAFIKITEKYPFDGAHLVLSTDEHTEDVVRFFNKHFLLNEPLTKYLEMTDFEEFDRLTREALSDNLSVLLVSNKTNEIIGARLLNIMKKTDQLCLSEKKDPKLKKFFDFLTHKDSEMNVFRYFGVDVVVHCFAMAVHQDYRRKGYAFKLMQAAMDFSKALGLDPMCMKGESTSIFTQRIYEKCGFETLHEFFFDDYKINGEVVFKKLGVHKLAKIYVKRF